MEHTEPTLLPWQLIRVSGPSMVPALRDGDLVLARHGASIRPGDLVLGTFADLPGRYVVKRAQRRVGDRWWLRSDNPAAGGDSESHGAGQVLARIVLRVRPAPMLFRRTRRLRPPDSPAM